MNAKQKIHQAKLNQWTAASRNRLTAVLPSDNDAKRTTNLSIPTITGSSG